MCNPTLFLIAGTLVTAGGQVQAGIAANEAGKANARTLNLLASEARERGAADEAEQRRQTAALKGQQAATFGSGGGEINTGGAAEILADTAQFGELDALRIRNNAEREAFAFESGAAISLAEGANARTSGFFGAAGTLLTGGSAVSAKWKVFRKDNPSATFGNFLRNTVPGPPPGFVGP